MPYNLGTNCRSVQRRKSVFCSVRPYGFHQSDLGAGELSRDSKIELKHAVESQYGGTATFVQFVPIHEEHNGQTVWDGTVAVFNLAGHPKTTRAYAWSYELPDGKRRSIAVLHIPPIIGPREAVRAAIVAERKRVPCPDCGGTGEIMPMRSPDMLKRPGRSMANRRCPTCRGTGVI
jgi:hypothetical protein